MPTLSPTPDHQPATRLTRRYDLMIVGGGIIGLTLASALRSSGLKIAVLEAQTPEQAAARPRA